MWEDLTNEQLVEYLKEIDEDEELEVSSWEACFLQTVLCDWEGDMTPRQRESAIQMCEKYLED